MTENNTAKKPLKIRPLTIIGIVLCLILLPVLVINVTLIIKSYTNKDTVPSIGGVFPMIVLTDSMYPVIESGDLIICRQEAPENVKVGDVIIFFDPMGSGTHTVTHRVAAITQTEEGELAFVTKGDYNNSEDLKPAPASKLVGVYESRIPKAGNVAMFMQTTVGLIVCVVLPLLVLVAIDLIRTRRFEKKHSKDTDALLRELEELRARQAAMAAPPSVGREDDPPEKKEAPPAKEEDPPAKDEEAPSEEDEAEERRKLQEMGDPEPMDLDVAPAEADLENSGDAVEDGGGDGDGDA